MGILVPIENVPSVYLAGHVFPSDRLVATLKHRHIVLIEISITSNKVFTGIEY